MKSRNILESLEWQGKRGREGGGWDWLLRKELTWHCAPRAAAARVLCLLLSTLSSHSPQQRLETQVYRTISLPSLISEIGSSDTRANVNESFEEMRNQRRRDWWRKSMLPPFFFQRLLIVCFLTSQPCLTFESQRLQFSSFFKTARSFAAFECRPVTQTGLLDVNMSIIFHL